MNCSKRNCEPNLKRQLCELAVHEPAEVEGDGGRGAVVDVGDLDVGVALDLVDHGAVPALHHVVRTGRPTDELGDDQETCNILGNNYSQFYSLSFS